MGSGSKITADQLSDVCEGELQLIRAERHCLPLNEFDDDQLIPFFFLFLHVDAEDQMDEMDSNG